MIWKAFDRRNDKRSAGNRTRSRPFKVERLEARLCLASVATDAIVTESFGQGTSVCEAISQPAIVNSFGLVNTVSQSESEQAASLGELTDRVSFPGEGFGSLRVSPTGELGQLYYIDQQLHYRFRTATGTFTDQYVADVEPYDFLSYTRGTPAQLIYQADGSPIVLIAQADGFMVYRPDSLGAWAPGERVTFQQSGVFDVTGHLLSEVGTDGTIHVVFTAGAWYIGRMFYATNATGTWSVTEIADPAAAGPYQHFFSLDARYVSMAVASDGSVHIAYTPEFLDFGEGGFRRPFDQLAYLTNRSGAWVTEIVHQPSDDSGQSGLASSIAITPNGQPAIASFFVDRYQTGSAVSSKLMFHQRDTAGNWSSEVVVDRPDGYVAGDGPKFTGFAPHLIYDAIGRAHIAFSDHASQHFPQFGAEEFAGQIRHAVKNANGWSVNTVFRQTDPLRSVLSFPTMAILPNEVVFAGIQRIDELDEDLNVISDRYNYVESVIPQTGITILAQDRQATATDSVNIVIERHHGDFSVATTVSVQSSDPQRIAPMEFVIPAGQVQLEVALPILSSPISNQIQNVTVNVIASGYYPGSTIVMVEPVDLKWHNHVIAHDVNNDSQVTPRDALAVINWIAITEGNGNAPTGGPVYYPDVNGDGAVTPRDALQVINFLAIVSSGHAALGEHVPNRSPQPFDHLDVNYEFSTNFNDPTVSDFLSRRDHDLSLLSWQS